LQGLIGITVGSMQVPTKPDRPGRAGRRTCGWRRLGGRWLWPGTRANGATQELPAGDAR